MRVVVEDPVLNPDPTRNGYAAYTAHRGCALLQAFAPAENLAGKDAIRYWHGPEDQGATAMQIHRPHDAWRVAWMKGWDQARRDAEAGKVEVTADV